MQVWGGLECSVVRIGNSFRNLIDETGHTDRDEDITALHSLGIKTVRYPVLWETIAPNSPDVCDWSWTDKRLSELCRLGIEPIAGLLHHGSGPIYTNLLDPQFPTLFARHAQRVAARYPWLRSFTPINEPLTTARFSCLYGHWYPHCTSMRDFLQALLIECKAIVLAMRAIRQITPGARLVQTEDLGRVFSTRALSYQAGFENERRWLSLDLLCGRVGRNHPWYDRFIVAGADERDLGLLLEGDCRPDVIGINHYVTSDRYLDERWRKYPQHSWGGNKHERYADVEAVRVDIGSADLGMKARLSEAWRRYHLPVAATEVHLGCTREHQLRWLVEAWNAAHELRASGQDIRAVTAWALFGSSDWSSLLVSRRKHYESGAFDVRGPKPRRTALASAVHALATEGKFAHPVLHGRGWWHRPDRYYAQRSVRREELRKDSKEIIIVASGALAFAELLKDICASRGLACSVLQLGDGRIADQISAHRAWAVLNLDARLLRRFREDGSRNSCYAAVGQVTELAQASARISIPLVHLSSDLVFDGSLKRPYVEHDSVSCRRAGRASVAAETAVLTHCQDALVVRVGPLFGVAGEEAANFAERKGGDITISPTFAPDLGNAVLDLLIDGERGIWHVANRGEIDRSDFAKVVSGLQHVVAPIPAAILGRKSRNFALASARGEVMPTLQDALARFIRARAEVQPQEPLQVAAE